MKNSKEILSSILKTTQMGQIGIRSVLDMGMRPSLHKALESQLQEYDSIESEAHSIASARGWELPELDPAVRFMSNMMTRMQLTGNEVDSKIAKMMVQGNTKGIIKQNRDIHRYSGNDEAICRMSQKLLDTEQNNLKQMYPFL